MQKFVIRSLYLFLFFHPVEGYWDMLMTRRDFLKVSGVTTGAASTGLIYTGVLLSASPNPLWNTKLLPIAFVASATVTGIALVIFILVLLRLCGVAAVEAHIPKLEKLNSWIIAFQLLVLILFMLMGIGSAMSRPQMIAMIGAGFGLLWWIGIIGLGLVVPLVLTLKGQARTPQISLVLSVLVLLGGFFLRYVILFAGQIT